MASLVDVFAELFRAFGYTPNLNVELEGTTGRRHPLTLVLEKDSRRVAVATWIHRQSLGPAFVREFVDAVKDTGCDGGIILSLGATPESLVIEAGQASVALWDSRRIAQELGNAVLRETCPDVWEQTDPWASPQPSRILDQVHESVRRDESPQAPSAVAVAEPAPAAPATGPMPVLQSAPETLQVPLAFGVLDQALAPPENAAAPTAPEPPPAYVAHPTRKALRLQVNRALATSLAKAKTRTVDRLFLRLVPNYVFDYEASLLIEGSLQSEKRRGRMAVDAALKRVREWGLPLETSDPATEGADVDEKPVRIAEAEARNLLAAELKTLVTRDVVLEEDDSEWSVVVKKKVELADEELRLTCHGVYYVPIWRASGRDGSVEIDATNGHFVQEDLNVAKSDALLI